MNAWYIRQFLHQNPNAVLHSTPDTLTVQNNANILVPESYQIIYSTGNMRITYSECVFVALGIQYAMRMRYIVICDLPCSTIFFHIIS